MKFILGKKLGMTQIFKKSGKAMPVTLIEAGPCFVAEIREPQKHGYAAVQIGFGQKSRQEKRKKDAAPNQFRYLVEFRLKEEEIGQYKKGDQIDVANFKEGEQVKVSGVSKGKGFQGVVKRWGFAGSPATHGHKHDERAPGSIGSSFPEKVFKGMRMAGRMGGKRATVKQLTIVKIDSARNILAVQGAVPGIPGGLLEIRTEV